MINYTNKIDKKPNCSPALPAGQALVLLSGEELDQLPDHGLRGHGQGGGELLPRPGEEQLGVQRLGDKE